MNKINLLLYSILSLFSVSCADNVENDLYKKKVYLDVDITTSDYALANPGSTKEITAPRKAGEYIGYGGILLYRSSFQVSNYPGIMGLYAFDLACPVEQLSTQRIYAIKNDRAKCDKCGTVYDLTFGLGNPIEGVGKVNLVTYKVSYITGDHIYFKVLN